MAITIKAHGALRDHLPSVTTVSEARSVSEAVAVLHIPAETGLAILVNGRLADWNSPLHDGDTIMLVPQLSGGMATCRHHHSRRR